MKNIKEKYLFKFLFNLLHLTVPHLKFCKNNPGHWPLLPEEGTSDNVQLSSGTHLFKLKMFK